MARHPTPTLSSPIRIVPIPDKQGDGHTYPVAGKTVTIHYTGKLVDFDQRTFDSSRARNAFRFKVGAGQVIPGLDEGVQKLSLASKAWIYIHYSYAYNEKGAPGPDLKKPEKNAIPPFACLKFKVQVISISD
eukprot:TRINITY_DN28471_c0_g1_i1.p1 TRINITY_DN28471_c0_g1~~TRINITY_DN28471_c0_g1_i1.p1  ORF type:complete len:140 (-),score=27.82 TRINITY_DN28471_c0_g1_i1:113-508(-)